MSFPKTLWIPAFAGMTNTAAFAGMTNTAASVGMTNMAAAAGMTGAGVNNPADALTLSTFLTYHASLWRAVSPPI